MGEKGQLLRVRVLQALLAVVLIAGAVSFGIVFGPRLSNKISSESSLASNKDISVPYSEPSYLPTVSPFPTAQPLAKPSMLPSRLPSQVPTALASDLPTIGPTLSPSKVPTSSPAPTQSMAPTRVATQTPTISSMPTFTVHDRWDQFRIKMHWESHFHWQEKIKETFWCIACASCNELNFSEDPQKDYNCTDSNVCKDGDQLWVRNCKDGFGARFRAKPQGDGILLRLHGFGTCVTRIRRDFLAVRNCNVNEPTQKWRPISYDQPFELIPRFENRNDDGMKYCVSQHHHPKDFEILGMKKCPKAQRDNTSLWGIYPLVGE